MKLRLLPAFALIAAVAPEVFAQDDALRRCRSISEASARLACYDAIALPAPARAGTAKPGSAAGTGAAGAAPMAAPSERFGLEHKAQPEQIDQVVSRIPGRFEGWRANSVITLENGQAWQVADGSWMGGRWDNPKVTIRRGVFGAFYLQVEDENRTVRVRRVK